MRVEWHALVWERFQLLADDAGCSKWLANVRVNGSSCSQLITDHPSKYCMRQVLLLETESGRDWQASCHHRRRCSTSCPQCTRAPYSTSWLASNASAVLLTTIDVPCALVLCATPPAVERSSRVHAYEHHSLSSFRWLSLTDGMVSSARHIQCRKS